MFNQVRTKSGKLLFRWDNEKMAVEISRRKKKTIVYLHKDGTYHMREAPEEIKQKVNK